MGSTYTPENTVCSVFGKTIMHKYFIYECMNEIRLILT